MMRLSWEVSEDFALQSWQYGLHNKAQDERGNPAETADTAKVLFIIERLAAMGKKS